MAVGVVLVIALVAFFVATNDSGGDEKVETAPPTTEAGPGEVFLEPTSSDGIDPFTDSVAAPTPSTTQPLGTPVALGQTGLTAPALGTPTSGGTASYRGGTPGLYGGTRDQRTCDPEKMVGYLTAHPDKAQAWADAQRIPVDQVPAFIRSLTPVLLRGDTRVTNHGFRNGVATAHQSVLQAGTAVLVDRYGEPQARCACGNPLDPPVPLPSAPSYQGAQWPGFAPANVTVVVKNTTIIKVITLIDVSTGQAFGRPMGPGPDVNMPTPTTVPVTTQTVPATQTTLPTGPGTFPPGTGTPGTVGPTSPPQTQPPATQPPASKGPLKLVSATHTVSELASSWTVDDRAGTAVLDLSATGKATYSWTVPQQLDPAGTSIDFGGAIEPAGANISIEITVRGTGLSFNTSDLAVAPGVGTAGRKSAVVTVPAGVDEVTLTYSMGYSVNAVYIYRR